jgi:hypothetical protein
MKVSSLKRVGWRMLLTLSLTVILCSYFEPSCKASCAQQTNPPFQKAGIILALKFKVLPVQELMQLITRRGVSFNMTSGDEQEIRQAGAYLGPQGVNNLIAAIRANFHQCATVTEGKWARVGDSRIDAAQDKLNDIEKRYAPGAKEKPTTLKVNLVFPVLKSLFYRPVYFDLEAEAPGSFLFTLCRTQVLIEYYMGDPASAPVNEVEMRKVLEAIYRLQRVLAYNIGGSSLAGSIDSHCDKYKDDKGEFINQITTINRAPDIESVSKAYSELKVALLSSGLIDKEPKP